MVLPDDNTKEKAETTLFKDREWSLVDGEICRVLNFIPVAEIKNGKVSSLSSTTPYASIHFECRKLPQIATGYITHKTDFTHLWKVFKERTVRQDQEVLFFWSKKHYRSYAKLFSVFLPRMRVMVCRKGAYQLHDPSFNPELNGEARFKAMAPIVDWKPEVMEETWEREFTSDSRRQSIPVSQLGHDLAEMTLDSLSLEEVSNKLFTQSGESLKIDDCMRNEWLILLMFSAKSGIQNADIQPDVMTSILDHYHYSIYQTKFNNDQERADFEQLVRNRYSSYRDIFNKHMTKPLEELGIFVSKQLMQSADIVLALLIAEFFLIHAESSRKFAEDVYKEFDLEM